MGGVYIRIQLLEDLNQTYSSPGCHSLRQSGRGGTFYRPTPILSEGLGGKPSERTSTRHSDRPGTEPRAFHIICHLSLATALADEDYGLHFTGRKAKAHKDYFSKKPQSWLVECWLRASLLRIHSPNTPNWLTHQWREKDLGIGKTSKPSRWIWWPAKGFKDQILVSAPWHHTPPCLKYTPAILYPIYSFIPTLTR